MDEKQLGDSAEELAADAYLSKGWTVLGRNCRYREGELDLVVERGEVVAFVEVRLRGIDALVPPIETVGRSKRRKLASAALLWIAEQQRPLRALRFDVASVVRGRRGTRVEIFENAFDLSDAGVDCALV